MQQRGRGWILMVSSIGAFQATPTYAIYSAAKAFVLSFGEALQAELRASGVKVSVLCPGVAATEFIETAGQRKTLYQRLNMMSSRAVAEAGIRALLAGKSCRIPGLQNSIPVFLLRFTPRRWATALAGVFMRND
jgi:short-subunit dehydrogenase